MLRSALLVKLIAVCDKSRTWNKPVVKKQSRFHKDTSSADREQPANTYQDKNAGQTHL